MKQIIFLIFFSNIKFFAARASSTTLQQTAAAPLSGNSRQNPHPALPSGGKPLLQHGPHEPVPEVHGHDEPGCQATARLVAGEFGRGRVS